jgi:hypothetical protein
MPLYIFLYLYLTRKKTFHIKDILNCHLFLLYLIPKGFHLG